MQTGFKFRCCSTFVDEFHDFHINYKESLSVLEITWTIFFG